MRVKFLKAYNGDAALLTFKEGTFHRNVLIDGGISATYLRKDKKGKIEYGELKGIIDGIRAKKQIIDLLIVTHVDDDHIGGILKWLENDKEAAGLIGKVWFNSGKLIKEAYETDKTEDYDNSIEFDDDKTINTSIPQGVKFEDFISDEKGHWERKLIVASDKLQYLGLEFIVISPNEQKLKLLLKKWKKEKPESLDTAAILDDYAPTLKEHIRKDLHFEEDTAVHNGSSISFILRYKDKNLLFLGDAHPTVLVNSLSGLGYNKHNPLKLDMVKLSHHGSMYNNSKELFELLGCEIYVVSTNGDKHCHPHKRLLARLINQKNSCKLYFNYPSLIDRIFSDEDRKDFPNVVTADSNTLDLN